MIKTILKARILRYLASIDTIQETDKDTFAANNITNTLTTIGAEAAVHH
jgi:demethylsterigmatocystin 6-O-methyltransferase